MLNISKVNQFFSPGQDLTISSLPSSEKSKIVSINGESNGGGLVNWSPNTILPSLMVLRANRAYLIKSVLSGSSFVPYTLSATDGGYHPQNNQMAKTFQFLTYRGPSNFDLNTLSSSIKSKIKKIYGPPSTATSNLRVWTPDQIIPSLRYLLPGVTYLVESKSQGFVPYDIGIPTEPSSSSSSQHEVEPSSSSSSQYGAESSSSSVLPPPGVGDESSSSSSVSSSSSSAPESELTFLNNALIPDAGLSP